MGHHCGHGARRLFAVGAGGHACLNQKFSHMVTQLARFTLRALTTDSLKNEFSNATCPWGPKKGVECPG